jgi:hypothetical protein
LAQKRKKFIFWISGSKTTNHFMSHTWKFFRAGGFDQVNLVSGADLANLDQLDQKLWVALACPTRGLEFDSRTLELIDADKDGRVRVPEVIAAAKWATDMLKNPDDLLKGSPTLPLAAISESTPEGKEVLSSAKQILINLGKRDATAISLEDTADTAKIFATTNFNGDGIIPADAADNDAVKSVINDIIACIGYEIDRSGKPGISQAKADAFFTEAQMYSDWWKHTEGDKNILPLGEATAAASDAVKTVDIKVNDYFARCRLAAFDTRATAALNRPEEEYLSIANKNLTMLSAEIAGFPLAQVAPGKPLPLVEGVNPAWAIAMARFQSNAVKPLLGDRTSLTEADWNALGTKLAPFETWSTSKVGAAVERLGLKRVHEILAGDAKIKINALIAKDKELEPEANAITAVEKLIRYNRDLYKLCVNFVNFRDFYERKIPAIFQAGRLYLDQRSCDLCLTVEDANKHSLMAGLAGAYLAYLDCVRPATGEKLSILAIFSQGGDDNLMVGRNGIFYDRKGKDYDATITKIVSNPISLRQAFFAPYVKLVRFVEEQITKRAAAAASAASANLQQAATAPAATAATAAKPKIDVGTVAAMGVAFGSIGTFTALVFTKFMDVVHGGVFIILIAFIAVILLISGPSMIIAFMKLRKRNLGPILDANGWAINSKAKISVPLGTSLTEMATLPPGHQLDKRDPYKPKKGKWVTPIVLAIIAYAIFKWLHSGFDPYLPDPLAHDTYFVHGTFFKLIQPVTDTNVPAAAPAPAATNAPPAK